MITLEVDGRPYKNFTSIEVGKSLDKLTGYFEFRATSTIDQQARFPIKTGQACTITVDGETELTGFIEVVGGSYASSEHEIVIQGRDKTADVVDSTIGGDIGFNEQNISIEKVTATVLKTLGITGIGVSVSSATPVAGFGTSEIVDADTGDTVFEYLERYSRKRQLLMTTDQNGDILYQRASGVLLEGFALRNEPGGKKNNILSASWTNNVGQLFNQYIMKSQGNAVALNLTGIPVVSEVVATQNPPVVDDLIRKSRIYHMVAESSSSRENLEKRAKWEANIARARAFAYQCIVQGHSRPGGGPWLLNRLVRIVDVFAGKDEHYLLNSITWRVDTTRGSTTSLGFVPKDSYLVELSEPEKAVKSAAVEFNFN